MRGNGSRELGAATAPGLGRPSGGVAGRVPGRERSSVADRWKRGSGGVCGMAEGICLCCRPPFEKAKRRRIFPCSRPSVARRAPEGKAAPARPLARPSGGAFQRKPLLAAIQGCCCFSSPDDCTMWLAPRTAIGFLNGEAQKRAGRIFFPSSAQDKKVVLGSRKGCVKRYAGQVPQQLICTLLGFKEK